MDKIEFPLDLMCRTCMAESESMYSLFDTEMQENDSTHSYAAMLLACANVQIDEDDDLPKCICEQCMKQLIISFSFKKQSERSDATLREIHKNPTIEFIQEQILPDTFSDIDSLLHMDVKFIPNTIEFVSTTEQDVTPSSPIVPKTAVTARKENNFQLTAAFLNDDVLLEDDDTDDFVFKGKRKALMASGKRAKTQNRCELCGKEFRSLHGLAYHTKVVHQGIKNFACAQGGCGKRFACKQALQKHTTVHGAAKTQLCALCGKTYGTYDALHYHVRAQHYGARPYLCVHCGKTFKQACHLSAHMWVHSGVKPHVCARCGKCYTSAHQLKKHVRKVCSPTTAVTPASTDTLFESEFH